MNLFIILVIVCVCFCFLQKPLQGPPDLGNGGATYNKFNEYLDESTNLEKSEVG